MVKNTSDTDQITAVVQDFIQVWVRFEAMLSKEMVKIQESLEDMYPRNEPRAGAGNELFYRVSSRLYGRDNLTMGELSGAIAVPLSTATRIVDWLVSNGYAERLHDEDDRRIVRVALTESGRELHKAIGSHINQRVQQILSSLTEEERNTLFSLIRKVVSALKDPSR